MPPRVQVREPASSMLSGCSTPTSADGPPRRSMPGSSRERMPLASLVITVKLIVSCNQSKCCSDWGFKYSGDSRRSSSYRGEHYLLIHLQSLWAENLEQP